MYANYAVFLAAHVVNFLFGSGDSVGNSSIEKNEHRLQWQELYEQVDLWHRERPEELLPIMTIPASKKVMESPFPILLYRTGAAGTTRILQF
jgi:hypothetical protein